MATSLDNGVTLLTLAPERVPLETIRALVERGVIVAAGHTAGTYEEIRAGLDAGVRGFTHLYNAMSPLQGREPGAVGAALEDRTALLAASTMAVTIEGSDYGYMSGTSMATPHVTGAIAL